MPLPLFHLFQNNFFSLMPTNRDREFERTVLMHSLRQQKKSNSCTPYRSFKKRAPEKQKQQSTFCHSKRRTLTNMHRTDHILLKMERWNTYRKKRRRKLCEIFSFNHTKSGILVGDGLTKRATRKILRLDSFDIL
jgi:hypothetical protein